MKFPTQPARHLLMIIILGISTGEMTRESACAQEPLSLYQQPYIQRPLAPPTIRDYSWIYIDPLTPREIKVHDILSVIVDEKAEVFVQSAYDRQRTGSFATELAEFLRIGEDGNVENAASNKPAIDASIQSRLQSSGKMSDREGIRYRIAATIVDVLPNGNLVLEARKTIRSNNEVWEYALTGILRSADVGANNTALSENIANLIITKKQSGKIHDATKRPWGLRILDKVFPF